MLAEYLSQVGPDYLDDQGPNKLEQIEAYRQNSLAAKQKRENDDSNGVNKSVLGLNKGHKKPRQ